jgi:hypothetical protein
MEIALRTTDVAPSDTEKESSSNNDEESHYSDVSESEPEDTHNEQLYTTRYGRAVRQHVSFAPMAASPEISAMISELDAMSAG